MCANYEPIRLSDIAKLGLPQPTFDFVSEAFPQDLCPILVAGHQADLEWRQAMFGLVPDWADDLKFSRHTYNARMETVATKPSYRSAWRKNQFALIPMQSFYEPCYESGKAVRWKIERLDHEPFTVGAIWDTWSDCLDTIRSFSMLTINADQNAVMKQFHKPEDEKRSLIIIPSELRKDWLYADHKTAIELIHEMSVTDFHGVPAPLVRKTKAKSMNNELF
jgi:putative SOS response-associated peptidase YedK